MSALGTADLTLERPAPSAPQASALAKTGTEATPRPPTLEPMARTATQSEERARQRVPIAGPSSGTRHSARRELDRVLSRGDRRWAPEEAMFRNAMRIAQLAGATRGSPQQPTILGEALSYFDQTAAIRLRRVEPKVEQAA